MRDTIRLMKTPLETRGHADLTVLVNWVVASPDSSRPEIHGKFMKILKFQPLSAGMTKTTYLWEIQDTTNVFDLCKRLMIETIVITGAISIITLACSRIRCILRRGSNGIDWGCGFSNFPIFPPSQPIAPPPSPYPLEYAYGRS